MDDDHVGETTRAFLVARARAHGCACPEPCWVTWQDVMARWDGIHPDYRAKLEWYRSQVDSEDDMIILDHRHECPVRRAAAAWMN